MSGPAPETPPEEPDLEQLLRISQGITGPADAMLSQMAALHWRWYQAWQEQGFTEPRAYGLLLVMVAGSSGITTIHG